MKRFYKFRACRSDFFRRSLLARLSFAYSFSVSTLCVALVLVTGFQAII